jgi:hypothetical protein
MNVKFPNNTSKWQMEFNSEFKGLIAVGIVQEWLKWMCSAIACHFEQLEYWQLQITKI